MYCIVVLFVYNNIHMNQSSFSFTVKSAVFVAIVLAFLIVTLVFSGVVELKNGWIPVISGNDPMLLLERGVKTSDTFSEEAHSILLDNIEKTRALIRTNPENAEAWLDLAISYKTANDLEGSVKIWKYLEEKNENSIAIQNLANTYHLDLKEYEMSEKYYIKILGLEPKNTSAYIGFHELYRYSYKQDTSAAIDILYEGLDKVDESGKTNIFLTLASYYTEKGDRESAISAYKDARSIAIELGNTALVRQIDEGLRFLRSQ